MTAIMRAYRALLHLYPTSFRHEYGEEMCAIFARRVREADGPIGAIALSIGAVGEVLTNAALVHWDILKQDMRYTARTLGRSPGFALTAILVVSLGIGATTAAFSVTDFVLIRPLPFPDSDRLVKLWERTPGYGRMELSPANYRDWKHLTRSFASMGAFSTKSINLVGVGDPQELFASIVTADLFQTLGARAALGRLFTGEDDRDGAAGTVVLSHRSWQMEFGGDAGVIGRRVILDDAPYTVIGVMPQDFNFPSSRVQLWVPSRLQEQNFQDRNDNWLEVVARLQPGVSLEQARAELDVVTAQLKQQYPKENEHHGAAVFRLHDEVSAQSRLLLMALSGAAICVLLIACANLANLLLARALARRKELAVRTAMGAGRERLVRQLLTESVVLAVLGGALGVALAVAAVPLLARLVPRTLPIAQAPAVDLRVLIFAGVLTGLTGIGFGMAPVLRAGGDLRGLREGARTGGGSKERLRSALVIAEIVASVVLLTSSGLLMRAMWTLQAVDPGFRTDGVLTLRTALPWTKYAETATRDQFYTRVLSEVRALPGVSGAAYISGLPMAMRGGIWPVSITGQPRQTRDDAHTASLRYVTPGFFATLGIPIRRGRDVEESDTRYVPAVAVVSQSFVRRYWPNDDPLGHHFEFGFQERVVVGVVEDVRVRGLERESEPQVYLAYKQVPDGSIMGYTPKSLVIRSSVAPDALVPSVRAIIRRADPQQPVADVRPLSAIVEEETASRAVQLRVLGAFAAVAFLLAGIGIHGVLSFAVSQRAREIGVRIALGAQSQDILTMVMRRAVWLAAAGVLPGVALAYAAGRAMEALLAGVRPGDAATFLTVVGLAVVMTIVGSLLPTLRALRVDPINALRTE